MATIQISDATYARLVEQARWIGVTPDALAETWLTPPAEGDGDGIIYESLEEFAAALEAEGKQLAVKTDADV